MKKFLLVLLALSVSGMGAEKKKAPVGEFIAVPADIPSEITLWNSTTTVAIPVKTWEYDLVLACLGIDVKAFKVFKFQNGAETVEATQEELLALLEILKAAKTPETSPKTLTTPEFE